MKLYQKIDPAFTAEFWTMIEAANHIVITTHISPDDDAISSLLAMNEIIKQRYPAKPLDLVISGEPVERFASFPTFKQIHFVSELGDELANADLLLMVDGNRLSRFSNQPEQLRQNFRGQTISLDHHATSPDSFDLVLVDIGQPATASLLYYLFSAELKIDKNLAELFLLGILGDTGNFAYLKPHQTDILTIAKKLLDIAQVEIQEFQSRYHGLSLRAFHLIQILMANTAYHQSAGWPPWQSSYLPRSAIASDHYSDNEISEASHVYMAKYLRTIKGYTWGLVLTPDASGEVSISGRSLPGSVNVRLIMEQAQLGGGHDRAAGGTFKLAAPGQMLEPADCLQQMITWLEQHPPVTS